VDDFIVTDYSDDCSSVSIHFMGMAGTPYESGEFEVKFRLRATFPFSAPKVTFTTQVFHPNIGLSGTVCMDMHSNWAPATTLIEVEEGCRALLGMPNPHSPLNGDAAHMLESDPSLYNDTARYWTSVFANGSNKPARLAAIVQEA
ncbi:SUMO-conjugating enzyme, partial [Frankliniella fusca]